MNNDEQNQIGKEPDALFARVVAILEEARSNVVCAVNSNMVIAYWLIGREIVQEVQGGAERAEYGKQVIEDLSTRLTTRYGQGFSPTTLLYFRKFYLTYPERCAEIPRPVGAESVAPLFGQDISRPLGAESSSGEIPSPLGGELAAKKRYPAGSELPQGFSPQLSWSHYRALMRVEKAEARDFYETEAVAGGWDKRTLERQIHSYYYERITPQSRST